MMKTMLITLLGALLTISTQATTTTTPVSEKPAHFYNAKSKVSDRINSLIYHPTARRANMKGTIEFTVKLHCDGTLELMQLVTDNRELGNFFSRQIGKIHLHGVCSEASQTYQFKFINR